MIEHQIQEPVNGRNCDSRVTEKRWAHVKSEEIASEDFRIFDKIANEYRRDELKKESNIQNEIAGLAGLGPNLNDQIGHTHAKSKDG